MEFKEIQALMQSFKDSDIRELEITQDSFQLYLSKNKQTHKLSSSVNKVENDQHNQPAEEKPKKKTVPTKDITAPLVGTIYLQPKPDEAPYVKNGSHIKKGDVVCVIEAMKMMTEIKSPFDGTVTAIHVSNEELVEVEQPLFSIEED
ncbi:acetyl-CoA carboxylase biotin carboxyl carrier protein subunit [Limosilactobacillus sp. WF-MT5-A]|uniref:acetyl-CoA carboxylase biotin carboxyl carrier protein n=1 Tax=Limosilactobacillus agrestis TaxID=2759748 RepID=UPI0015F884D4|nr:acetyl-CoA carboxylase biotin carboxyl carrier protein subunit [Limosilactobacillus agrestis]MBB1100035.1 acetyl-CoA carboxylase biotin carboxyl carrier protein subunit [Limosilactobacillus agrestis]MCD7127164.1 acetyl-CoA carboxylase biotin carboxyl carrier protein subunit [Limosilactobacillus agrestis]